MNSSKNSKKSKSKIARSPGSPKRRKPSRSQPGNLTHWQAFRQIFSLKNIKRFILTLGIMALFLVIILHQYAQHERIQDEGYTHAEQFANHVVVDGIDVSYAQGDSINWNKVKKSGVDFVFIRVGYRGAEKGTLNTDETFERNIQGAQKAGLMVGVYFYSQAFTPKEAQQEAQYILKLVEPYELELPIVMDYEIFPGGRLEKAHSTTDLLTPKAMNRCASKFCQTVEEAGYESMVYANYDFLVNYLDGEALADRTNIWVAHFNDSTSYPYEYQFWQCSDQSTAPGIDTNVDKDFWYIDPNGYAKTTAQNAKDRISLSECSVELKSHSSRYMGFNVEPDVKVTYDGKKLKKGRDYSLGYVKNAAPGTAYVIVIGKGDYKDMVTQSFVIKKFL